MDKQVITEELHVVEEDLIKIKLGLNRLDNHIKEVEGIQTEIHYLVDALNEKQPKGYYEAPETIRERTEEDYQKLFILIGVGVIFRLQAMLDSLTDNTNGNKDEKSLLSKSVTSLRCILFNHSRFASVEYSLNYAKGCLTLITSDETGNIVKILKELADLITVIEGRLVTGKEVLSEIDLIISNLKSYLDSELSSSDKRRIQVSIDHLREVSLFLQAVLSK